MTLAQLLTIAQIAVSLLSLLTVVFIAGRLFERMTHMARGIAKIETALFGADGSGTGAFVSRTEAAAMNRLHSAESESFERRLASLEEA